MMAALCGWLGLPVHRQATAQDLTEQVIGVLRDLRTSMVVIDEVHNLRTRSTSGAEAASALKGFSERLDAAFLYVGVDPLDADLFSGSIGQQLAGRMTMYQMQGYGNGTARQRDDWADLVAAVEDLLPLVRHKPQVRAPPDQPRRRPPSCRTRRGGPHPRVPADFVGARK